MSLINRNYDFDWVVVGAGPAGIAAVGKLLDSGINPNRLAWIDPCFSVGDFGSKWANVPSNTTVNLFLNFLNACHSFHYLKAQEDFEINHLDPQNTCHLNYMAKPLAWVTQQLKQQVCIIDGYVKELVMQHNRWNLTLSDKIVHAKNVILAIGSEPKIFSHSNIETIPLEIAMDQDCLFNHSSSEDTIAVFGSSHSAILIIRSLLEICHVKKVINFYRAPLRYAINLGDEILFDNTGLKGATAIWARKNLHSTLPPSLQQVFSSPKNIERFLPECNKAIYAIGFERRELPIVGFDNLAYNPYNGIIAPGLFGLGIAYPQAKTDSYGNLEYRVGLWKFMQYLTNILPLWMQYPL